MSDYRNPIPGHKPVNFSEDDIEANLTEKGTDTKISKFICRSPGQNVDFYLSRENYAVTTIR